jgi:sugar lactone lactonase YvrE
MKTLNNHAGSCPIPRPPAIVLRAGMVALAWLFFNIATAQAITFTLGTTTLLEGPAAGSDSVVLSVTPSSGAWSAAANASWLHLSAANQNGSGSANVIFNFDENPGTTRSGTLTIGNQTLTVAQAGLTYIPATTLTTLVSNGLSQPRGVAVDSAGNVFIADSGNNAVKEWFQTNGSMTTLVSSDLNNPFSVAVDSSGNVYIADRSDNTILEWMVTNGEVRTLVSTGLYAPSGVAVDAAGNVYIADGHDEVIFEWSVTNGNLVTLSSLPTPYICSPPSVAVDRAGNVFFDDTCNDGVLVWSVTNHTVSAAAAAAFYLPAGVAVDGSDNVYIADQADDWIWKASAANNSTSVLVAGFNRPDGVAVDSIGNIYIADTDNNAIRAFSRFLVDPTPRLEGLGAGGDSFPSVLPAANPLLNMAAAPISEQSWLTITGVTNGVLSFVFTASVTNRTGTIQWLGQDFPVIQAGLNRSLGATALLEGPNAGADSVVLSLSPLTTSWTATANASWLHLDAANQSGFGPAVVIFSFDTNFGATRYGTLTIAGQTLTVTQAGSTYSAVGGVTTLFSGIPFADGTAVDGAGNVYVAVAAQNKVVKWSPATGAVTTVVSSGLDYPVGVELDTSADIYIGSQDDGAIKKATGAAANAVVNSAGSFTAFGVDTTGNLYFAGNSIIYKWTAANGVVSILASTGIPNISSVAVDAAADMVYFTSGNTLNEWSALSNSVTQLASSSLFFKDGLAVDGEGDLYAIARDYFDEYQAVMKWTAANNTLSTLADSWEAQYFGVTVDGTGNVYYTDAYGGKLYDLAYAFVDSTPRTESSAGGQDSLPVVLPVTENLQGVFAPSSDSSWLTITGVTNGVVSFSVPRNLGPTRTGYINVLGQNVAITQIGPVFTLGLSTLTEAPAAGSDSVVLGVAPNNGVWTTTTTASWIHLSAAFQSGVGSTNVIFTYDTNPGGTRYANLTIDGQTVTVTQAGSSYVPVDPLTTLVSTNLSNPSGVAVDGLGNVYIANATGNAIDRWNLSNNTTTPILTGLNGPAGVAVDLANDVYIADTGNNAIKEWLAVGSNVITLVSGLNGPSGVAVDVVGNVYIADTGNNAIKEFFPATSNVTTLVSGLNAPSAVAVDVAGNVYIADAGNLAVKEWSPVNRNLTTLISGMGHPAGVAVDGAGNVYATDSVNDAIKKWTATSGAVSLLNAPGLNGVSGVAVDGTLNVYLSDTSNNAVKELPYAFVDPTPRAEVQTIGTDQLPAVEPTTENLFAPFAPTSDQSWLTNLSVLDGAVGFSFSANPGVARAGHLTVLGQPIVITQIAANVTAPLFSPPSGTGLTNGSLIGLSCATPGAVIYFTTNGSPASTNSAVYSTPVVFMGPGPFTIQALAQASQYSGVKSASATYTFPLATSPVFTPASGPLTNGAVIAMSCATAGASIYYTLDGSTPSTNSTPYSGALTFNGSVIVNAIAVAPACFPSAMTSVIYYQAQVAPPQFTPGQGPVTNGTMISITNADPSAVIYYTVDGSTPTTNSPIYTTALLFTNQFTLQAQAFAVGDLPSPVQSVFYGLLDPVPNVAVTTFAGSTAPGLLDGIGPAAQFSHPEGICMDANGNLFVSDNGNNVIREILPSGQVITYAGNGTITNSQSPSATNAFFNDPAGVCLDATGNLYVADSGNNNRICKIGVDGSFSIYAYVRPGMASGFGQLTFGPDGNLYAGNWAEAYEISTNGSVQGLAGTSCFCGGGWALNVGIGLDTATNLYAATGDIVWLIPPGQPASLLAGGSGQISDGPALKAGFGDLSAAAVDASGNVYMSDYVRIRKLSASGWVSTVAGSGAVGFADGPGTAAQFDGAFTPNGPPIFLMGLCFDPEGNLYVADTGNNCIRKVSFNTPALPTLQWSCSSNTLTLAWPSWATDFVLESRATLSPSPSWAAVSNATPVVQGGTNYTWTVPIGNGEGYYRLHRP